MLLPLMAEQLLITLYGHGKYLYGSPCRLLCHFCRIPGGFHQYSGDPGLLRPVYRRNHCLRPVSGAKKIRHAIRSAEQTLFIVTLISLVTAAFCILFDLADFKADSSGQWMKKYLTLLVYTFSIHPSPTHLSPCMMPVPPSSEHRKIPAFPWPCP